MENKQETARELDLDQLEKVSGGTEITMIECPRCKKSIPNTPYDIHTHLHVCTGPAN